MIIKLQSDQVVLFWDMIKQGIVTSYRIPNEYRQDFTIKSLEHLLSGKAQAWVGYEINGDDKKIHYVLTTKIVDEKHYGIRYLSIESLYGFRLISQEILNEMYEGLKEFALANNCNVMLTSTLGKRAEDMLLSLGFEKYKVISRKFLT